MGTAAEGWLSAACDLWGQVHLFERLAGYWASNLDLFPLEKAHHPVWKGLKSILTY